MMCSDRHNSEITEKYRKLGVITDDMFIQDYSYRNNPYEFPGRTGVIYIIDNKSNRTLTLDVDDIFDVDDIIKCAATELKYLSGELYDQKKS